MFSSREICILVRRTLEGYKAFSLSFSVGIDFSELTVPMEEGATKLDDGSDPATTGGDPVPLRPGIGIPRPLSGDPGGL